MPPPLKNMIHRQLKTPAELTLLLRLQCSGPTLRRRLRIYRFITLLASFSRRHRVYTEREASGREKPTWGLSSLWPPSLPPVALSPANRSGQLSRAPKILCAHIRALGSANFDTHNVLSPRRAGFPLPGRWNYDPAGEPRFLPICPTHIRPRAKLLRRARYCGTYNRTSTDTFFDFHCRVYTAEEDIACVPNMFAR